MSELSPFFTDHNRVCEGCGVARQSVKKREDKVRRCQECEDTRGLGNNDPTLINSPIVAEAVVEATDVMEWDDGAK